MTNKPNFVNRTMWTHNGVKDDPSGDNLHVMRGLNSKSVDLIYLDPPFNSNRDYAAPIGTTGEAKGAGFKDTWTLSDLKVEEVGLLADKEPALADYIRTTSKSHSKGMQAYLTFMGIRLLEMRRVLKPTGSVWLHCDDTASHYLKQVMDCVFGRENFRNEVTWQRIADAGKSNQYTKRTLGRNCDTLLHYSKTDDFVWHGVFLELSRKEMDAKFPHRDLRGRYHTKTGLFRGQTLGERPNLCYEYDSPHGPVENPHSSGWMMKRERLAKMDENNEIIWRKGKRPLRKSYADAYKGKPVSNLWPDIPIAGGKERTGYPTQKPLALLDRIIKASTNKNDVVLDPFCGCATACVSADNLGRQWIGIDLSPKAANLVIARLGEQMGVDKASALVTHNTDIPKRTDQGKLPPYRTHKHDLYGEQEGRCKGCEKHFEFRHFEVDHRTPRSRGGTDHKENLQLLCGSCNRIKGKESQAHLKARLRELGLLHANA